MIASGYIQPPEEGVRTMADRTYDGAEIMNSMFKASPESDTPPQESAYDGGERAFNALGLKKKEDGDPRHNGAAASQGSAGY